MFHSSKIFKLDLDSKHLQDWCAKYIACFLACFIALSCCLLACLLACLFACSTSFLAFLRTRQKNQTAAKRSGQRANRSMQHTLSVLASIAERLCRLKTSIFLKAKARLSRLMITGPGNFGPITAISLLREDTQLLGIGHFHKLGLELGNISGVGTAAAAAGTCTFGQVFQTQRRLQASAVPLRRPLCKVLGHAGPDSQETGPRQQQQLALQEHPGKHTPNRGTCWPSLEVRSSASGCHTCRSWWTAVESCSKLQGY